MCFSVLCPHFLSDSHTFFRDLHFLRPSNLLSFSFSFRSSQTPFSDTLTFLDLQTFSEANIFPGPLTLLELQNAFYTLKPSVIKSPLTLLEPQVCSVLFLFLNPAKEIVQELTLKKCLQLESQNITHKKSLQTPALHLQISSCDSTTVQLLKNIHLIIVIDGEHEHYWQMFQRKSK